MFLRFYYYKELTLLTHLSQKGQYIVMMSIKIIWALAHLHRLSGCGTGCRDSSAQLWHKLFSLQTLDYRCHINIWRGCGSNGHNLLSGGRKAPLTYQHHKSIFNNEKHSGYTLASPLKIIFIPCMRMFGRENWPNEFLPSLCRKLKPVL